MSREYLHHPDAIACDIPEEMMTAKEKLPTVDKISCNDFYDMIMSSKSKGNLIWAFDQFMRYGTRRGYINLVERPDVIEKLKKYSIPLG